MKNWKTTLLGILVLLGSAAQGFLQQSQGKTTDLSGTVAGVAAGVGLIAAKDHNQ